MQLHALDRALSLYASSTIFEVKIECSIGMGQVILTQFEKHFCCQNLLEELRSVTRIARP